MSLQTVVARNVDPAESAVVTVGRLRAGDALNVIPGEAELGISVRSYSPQVRAISMCLFILFGAGVIAYGLLMHRRYLSYLEREQRYRAADTPQHLTNRSS